MGGAVIVYGLVLLVFGLPIVNENITKGANYANIAKASTTTASLYQIYNYAWFATIATAVIGIILACIQGWIQRSITSRRKAVILVTIMHGEFWASILAIIVTATMAISNYAIYNVGGSEALKEFARAYSVKLMGGTILFIVFSFYLAKQALYYRLRNAAKICSDYYIDAHLKAVAHGDNAGAQQAIEKACDICPTDVSAWSIRSHFANVILSNKQDAILYLDRARMLLSQEQSVRKEDRSNYEFFLGTYLLSREEYQKAIEHISKSIDLVYSKKREEYLEKVKRAMNEKVE